MLYGWWQQLTPLSVHNNQQMIGENKWREDGIQWLQWAVTLICGRDEWGQGGRNGKWGNEVNATIKLMQWWLRLKIAFNINGGGRRQWASDFWQGSQWWQHWQYMLMTGWQGNKGKEEDTTIKSMQWWWRWQSTGVALAVKMVFDCSGNGWQQGVNKNQLTHNEVLERLWGEQQQLRWEEDLIGGGECDSTNCD